MRTIFQVSAEKVKIADWVADDAVCCELLSSSNSLIIRENTGNFFDFCVDPSGSDVKSLGTAWGIS
jgi:hypothetical protein